MPILFFSLFRIPVLADEIPDENPEAIGKTVPTEFHDFINSLPQQIRDLLPPEILSDDTDGLAEGVKELSDFSNLLEVVLAAFGLRFGDCLQMLATVAGLLILSAICNAFRTSFRSETIGKAFSFATTLCVLSVILVRAFESVKSVTGWLERLTASVRTLIPLMGVLYTLGGNVSTATASAAGLSVYLTLLENVVAKSILPFCGICLALSAVSALEPDIRTGSLLSTLKKNYTIFLSFLMTLLLAMLSSQTLLSARADSVAMRGVKFAAGNMIPVVGGSVSELLRTVSDGVGYLRGAVGVCAVLLVLLLLLPTVAELFLWHLTWQIAASFADLLGLSAEQKLLDGIASLCGYLLAAVCICASVLLLSLTILAHCGTAMV